jgi:hypothetical protein
MKFCQEHFLFYKNSSSKKLKLINYGTAYISSENINHENPELNRL